MNSTAQVMRFNPQALLITARLQLQTTHLECLSPLLGCHVSPTLCCSVEDTLNPLDQPIELCTVTPVPAWSSACPVLGP